MKLDETCSCGATITADDGSAPTSPAYLTAADIPRWGPRVYEVERIVKEWRETHHHETIASAMVEMERLTGQEKP